MSKRFWCGGYNPVLSMMFLGIMGLALAATFVLAKTGPNLGSSAWWNPPISASPKAVIKVYEGMTCSSDQDCVPKCASPKACAQYFNDSQFLCVKHVCHASGTNTNDFWSR